MLRAFWTWDPVSGGQYEAFDESYAYVHNKWFFDKSVWQKMFRTMTGCGFDSMILANTHPFPFMLDLPKYPSVIDETALADYQAMHRWVFETALNYDIEPYMCFFPLSGSEPMTDYAVEYMQYCVRQLLETYP